MNHLSFKITNPWRFCLFLLMAVFSAASFAHSVGAVDLTVPMLALGMAPEHSGLMAFTVALSAEQTGMVLAYKNKTLIADQVMPRTPLLSTKRSFQWFERDVKNAFTAPDTLVGRRSRPNSIEFTGIDRSGTCLPHGLEGFVPQDDIEENGGNATPLVTRELESLIGLVQLRREFRVATLVQDTANYDPTCSTTLSGTSKLSDPTCDGVATIITWLDKPLMRPNRIGMADNVWSAVRANPAIVKAANKSSGDKGLVTKQEFCDLFEIPELIIGPARINSANRGQSPNLGRCWGNAIWGHYWEPSANEKDGLAWGITVQSGDRYSDAEFQKSAGGLKGGVRVVAGEYLTEIVTAKLAGFLLLGAT